MRSIWEGNLLNVLDNIKLCVIIENLHFWAMNHLRPWLSGCIDQWTRVIDEFEAERNRPKQSNDVKARSLFGDRIIPMSRSKQSYSYGQFNFALRRANTLESRLDQDEDHANSDDTAEGFEEEDEDRGEEDDEEDDEEDYGEDYGDEDTDDGDDDYEPESEDQDEEREEKIHMALKQLEISLRNDKRGMKALETLQDLL